jgi:hypothetical protein
VGSVWLQLPSLGGGGGGVGGGSGGGAGAGAAAAHGGHGDEVAMYELVSAEWSGGPCAAPNTATATAGPRALLFRRPAALPVKTYTNRGMW